MYDRWMMHDRRKKSAEYRGPDWARQVCLFAFVLLVPITAAAQDYSVEIEAFFRRGRLDSAVASSQAFVADYPDSAQAHGYLGTMYTESGRVADAVDAFTRLTELQPTSPTGYRNLAVLLARVRHHPAAVAFRQHHQKPPPRRCAC